MSDESDDKNDALSSKFRLQIDLQQTEESLRSVKNQILSLDIQIRKYQQDYTKAKINLELAEANMKRLKIQEFELNQNAMRQKRACISEK